MISEVKPLGAFWKTQPTTKVGFRARRSIHGRISHMPGQDLPMPQHATAVHVTTLGNKPTLCEMSLNSPNPGISGQNMPKWTKWQETGQRDGHAWRRLAFCYLSMPPFMLPELRYGHRIK